MLLNQRLVFGWLDGFMQAITQGKSLQLLAAVIIGISLIQLRQRALPVVLIILCALALSNSLSDVIKNTVERPRPFVTEEGMRLLVGKGKVASFPSSHASNSAAVAMAALLALGLRSWRRRATVGFLGGLAFIVGWSRIYVGAHFPADVLVGWVLGIIAAWSVHALWLKFYPLIWSESQSRLRVDFFGVAIIVSVLLGAFRLAYVAASDQGLTAGESLIWWTAKHPEAIPRDWFSNIPALLPWAIRLAGADESTWPFAVRWPFPLITLLSLLILLFTLWRLGMGKLASASVILVLQSIPAVNASSIWLQETSVNGLPWSLALMGWVEWKIHRKPWGIPLIVMAMVLALGDIEAFLLIGVALWLLEHFRGDYVRRPANLVSLIVGLGLLAACILYRFFLVEPLNDQIWTWSWLSVILAAGPGTILLGVFGSVMGLLYLVRVRGWRHVLGLRRRVMVLYSLGTALGAIWLGANDHLKWVVLMVLPGLVVASLWPLFLRIMQSSVRPGPWIRNTVVAFVALCFSLNIAVLYGFYDRNWGRHFPKILLEPRWLSEWERRTQSFVNSVPESIPIYASDPLTAAAVSQATSRPILYCRPTRVTTKGVEYQVRDLNGQQQPLHEGVLLVASWNHGSMRPLIQLSERDQRAVDPRPVRGVFSKWLPLDRQRTVVLSVYEIPGNLLLHAKKRAEQEQEPEFEPVPEPEGPGEMMEILSPNTKFP